MGLACVGLLAVVALASGARGRGAAPADPRGLPLGLFDYLYTLGVLLIAAAFVAVLFLRRPGPGRGDAPTGFLRTAVFLGAVTALAVLLLQRAISPEVLQEALQRLNLEPAGGDGIVQPGSPSARPAEFRWELALALGLAIAALALWFRLRPRALPRERRPGIVEELATLLDDTLDDLRAERDARRAVIAAYARMERAIAAHGLPRAPAEAPLEYLGRVLRELSVSAASALDLTSLFERAKFSPHAVDEGMKDEAITALASVRDDLRAAAA